ncbi:MAG: cytochrome c family protein [Pseudomonadota bacterium]
MKSKVEYAIPASLFSTAVTPAFAKGGTARSESIFKQCASCHALGENVRRLSVPKLNGLPGASVAYDEEQRYAPSLSALHDEGFVSTAENLDAFLAAPREFSLRNRGSFAALRDQQDRADVIAYIVQFADVR